MTHWPQVQPYGNTERPVWPAGLAECNPLYAQAKRLYPAYPALQREYVRAVSVVRSSSRGWVLDRKVERANG